MDVVKVYLMIDSDTRLEFPNSSVALQYANRKGLTNTILLTTYTDGKAFRVFNPYLTKELVRYFETEKDAMYYIGTFI